MSIQECQKVGGGQGLGRLCGLPFLVYSDCVLSNSWQVTPDVNVNALHGCRTKDTYILLSHLTPAVL